jgi:hypothetical protein
VVEVDMHGGKNILVMVVLDIGQLLAEHTHVVIINQRDGSQTSASGEVQDF